MFAYRHLYRTLVLLTVPLLNCVGTSQTANTVSPASAAAPETKTAFRDCPECPEMVAIPAGSFQMGSPAGEAGHYDEEGPQREVKVSGFAASAYDVTRGQWKAFVQATHRKTAKGCEYGMLPKGQEANASWMNLGFEQDDSHPIVCITWADAHDYVQWLSQKTGSRYRLLTEAEWEYAARAGSTTPYPWGKTASHENANYGGDDHAGYGVALGRDKWIGTSPVGSFPPNAFGLYDMHGNAMQWVEDCLATSYTGLPLDGTAYTTPVTLHNTGYYAPQNGKSSCSYRMLRGGCWGDTPAMIRSASRNNAPAPGWSLDTYRSSGVSMRVAKELH